jgi:hypothetical protein
MDYHGTTKDDIINAQALGLPDFTNVFGDAGNDIITVANGGAIGDAGNDTLIGLKSYSTAAYWSSPAGIKANLATGLVQDGFGTTDTLKNIFVLQDSGWSDEITGSAADETFWLSGGNDRVTGGGGNDTIILYNVKATEVSFSYDAAGDTFTMRKHLPNGDNGTTMLTGIASIQSTGDGSDHFSVTRDMFDGSKGFLRGTTIAAPLFDAGQVQQLRAGDFNGDGKLDVLITRVNFNDVGVAPIALQVLAGDGAGHFTDQTASLFAGGIPYVHYVARIFAGDFNKDGVSDIFTPDFGVDGPPFPGGQNSLFLSSGAGGLIANASATLPQGLRQNHGTSLGDINHDGYFDIFVNALNDINGHANDLLVNDGTGHFVSSPSLLPAAMSAAVPNPGVTWSMLKDLNNDGYADIVLGTWDTNPNPGQVLFNDGHGSFAHATPVNLPRSGIEREIVIGIETIDLNGDTLPDLMLSVTNGGTFENFYQVPYLQLLVNQGNGQFRDETDVRLPQSKTLLPGARPQWYLSSTAVDFNDDGAPDILIDGAGGVSKVLLNDGKGNFTKGWESAVGAHVLAADIDGDGLPDLIESSGNGLTVLHNTYAHHDSLAHIIRAGPDGSTIAGGAAAETIYSGRGNDTVDGGAGLDRMVFAGHRADYTITRTETGFRVADRLAIDGTDTLANVERIAFADASVALDTGGSGGQAYRLYQAAFHRAPDADGLGFQMWAMDAAGFSLTQVAQGFIDSPEFAATYGSLSNSDFVTQLYANVLHRAADAQGLKFHVDLLNAGTVSRAQDLAGFSESPENQAALIGIIGNGFAYVPH